MPAPASVPEFLDLVRKSQLLPDSNCDDFVERHRALGTLPSTIDQTASLLVREAQLTFFQAKQLKLGRYKRFTIGSKYRLLELIGAGGMGAVYLCEHTLMRRLVALKVLPGEKLEDESNKERFYREARAVAALDHPNIVRAYDIDTYEKLHFLVMEYVDGTSLQEVVARYIMDKKLFDPIRAAHYIAQAAIGMQHAHELGMVHRDIKPGNLLLERTGVIKVLDMGLARFFNKQQDSVTEKYDHNCVLGTADYLAPEQAVSNMVDIRADIYALGGTLYFMLTGHTPFPDGTIAAKLVAHQTREPRPVESFRSDVPSGLLAVLRMMMAKNPADRHQNPIEVADALSEWAEQPISSPPSREMPFHCPLVQALSVPPAVNSAATPLARALFGPGRGVFARNGSGGSTRSGAKLLAGSTGSYVAVGANGNRPNEPASDAQIGLSGPVSTGRASAAPTSPLQNPARSRTNGAGLLDPISGSRVHTATPRRTVLYVLIGLLFSLVFIAGAIVAYNIGKGNKTEAIEEGHIPGPADKILSPVQAMERIGEVQTVEFVVASAIGAGYLALNSEKDATRSNNLAVRISQNFFQAAGDQRVALLSRTEHDFQGKMVRVRGAILRDEQGKGIYLEVRSPRQIITVSD